MHALLYITLCELKTADLGPLQSIKPVLLFFAFSLVCLSSYFTSVRLTTCFEPISKDLLLNPDTTAAQWMISPFHYTLVCTTDAAAALYSSSNVSDTLETRYLIGNEP